jgi:phage-related protein
MVQKAPLKKIEWIKGSRRSLKAFPDEARYQAGSELLRVQEGKLPSDWKPMRGIGTGAIEIRIHMPHEHRVVYVAKFEEGIYVLHCFEKKTQRTAQKEIEIARSAYAEMQRVRESISKKS